MDNDLIIVGAGKHARETYFLLEDIGYASNFKAFVQDKVEPGKQIIGKPVISVGDIIAQYKKIKKPLLIGAIGSIEDNKKMIHFFINEEYQFFNAISKTIPVDRQKFIGTGVTIAQGTILTTNISIGDYTIINIGCNISHDVAIGQFVNISPGVNLAGNVKIDDEVFIGTGATVIPGITIGNGSVIAAGACVIKDVPPYSLVAGVPGVIKKRLK